MVRPSASKDAVSKAAFFALMMLLLPAAAAAADLGFTEFENAAAVGFSVNFFDISESERLKLRTKAGWHKATFKEPEEYRKLQERRQKEILAIPSQQERLDNFVQFAQARAVRNLTKNGFKVVKVDPDLHARLKQRLEEKRRSESAGKMQGIYGGIPKFVDHGQPTLLRELQGTMEEWAGTKLEPSVAYGIRIYERGASLAFHTDRVETHVISGILHVDHKTETPWTIDIEGHDGQRHSVDLKPGEMLLYESAKCPHGRATALNGDFYASVFVHFKPKVWPYSIHDIWLAVPPGWKAGVSDDEPGIRWAGAFLTHSSMTVAGMPGLPSQNLRRRRRQVPDEEEEEFTLVHHRERVAKAIKNNDLPRERKHHHHDPPPKKKPKLNFATVFAAILCGISACAVLATASLVLRRAYLTKGRSLVRRQHHKS